jgi:magnesium chelatase family protein
LLDRIDLRVQLTRVAESEWQAAAGASGPSTIEAAAQVMAARRIQLERSGVLNSALSSAQLAENLGMSWPAQQLLLAASAKMQLSARAKQRVERVARTLADLDASAAIAPCHVAEALQLRRAS